MLRFMGLQRVGHDLATELNMCFSKFSVLSANSNTFNFALQKQIKFFFKLRFFLFHFLHGFFYNLQLSLW